MTHSRNFGQRRIAVGVLERGGRLLQRGYDERMGRAENRLPGHMTDHPKSQRCPQHPDTEGMRTEELAMLEGQPAGPPDEPLNNTEMPGCVSSRNHRGKRLGARGVQPAVHRQQGRASSLGAFAKLTGKRHRFLYLVNVTNTGDRAIEIGSHYHFFEVNRALDFDRAAAFGMRLDIPAGVSRRFEPGESKDIELVAFGGTGKVSGFNGLTNGSVHSEDVKTTALERARAGGFKGV